MTSLFIWLKSTHLPDTNYSSQEECKTVKRLTLWLHNLFASFIFLWEDSTQILRNCLKDISTKFRTKSKTTFILLELRLLMAILLIDSMCLNCKEFKGKKEGTIELDFPFLRIIQRNRTQRTKFDLIGKVKLSNMSLGLPIHLLNSQFSMDRSKVRDGWK